MTANSATNTSSGAGDFVISRTFDAPRDLVFKAWTEPQRLKEWFGPAGTSIAACTMDLRPGGIFHYGMRSPDGAVMWGKWTFREIVVPERLVFIASFSDEQAGITRHPFSPTWPLHMLSTITFVEESGKTTVTIRWSAYEPTETERNTFESSRDGMNKGWTGTLDRFAEYLRDEAKPV